MGLGGTGLLNAPTPFAGMSSPSCRPPRPRRACGRPQSPSGRCGACSLDPSVRKRDNSAAYTGAVRRVPVGDYARHEEATRCRTRRRTTGSSLPRVGVALSLYIEERVIPTSSSGPLSSGSGTPILVIGTPSVAGMSGFTDEGPRACGPFVASEGSLSPSTFSCSRCRQRQPGHVGPPCVFSTPLTNFEGEDPVWVHDGLK